MCFLLVFVDHVLLFVFCYSMCSWPHPLPAVFYSLPFPAFTGSRSIFIYPLLCLSQIVPAFWLCPSSRLSCFVFCIMPFSGLGILPAVLGCLSACVPVSQFELCLLLDYSLWLRSWLSSFCWAAILSPVCFSCETGESCVEMSHSLSFSHYDITSHVSICMTCLKWRRTVQPFKWLERKCLVEHSWWKNTSEHREVVDVAELHLWFSCVSKERKGSRIIMIIKLSFTCEIMCYLLEVLCWGGLQKMSVMWL